MDRSQPPGVINNYFSITDAVHAVSGPGTTITVFGDGSATGVIPYSDAHPSYPESFPIMIPAGTTLVAGGSLPVYVWNTNPSAPDLITIGGAATPTLTRIIGINFLGGANAILAKSTSSAAQIKLQVKDCRFAYNQFGVTAIGEHGSNDGYVECSVRSSTFGDTIPATSSVPPFQNKPTVGIRFHSNNTSSAGVLGEVIDLNTVGGFSLMKPDGLLGTNDLAAAQVTRLVEVLANGGDANRVQYPGAPSGNYAPQQVNEAFVTIQGGDWNGGDTTLASGGWDIGLLAQAIGVDTALGFKSFTCGYQVTMTGTTLTGFREEAIYADGTLNGRGLLTVNGGSILQSTGSPTATFDDQRHNGIHAYTIEGYMGVILSGSQLLDNRGNGLYANTDGEFSTSEAAFELGAPFGLYLDIQKDKIHRNEANGVYLRNERNGQQPHGFIGGTIHQDPGKLFNLDSDSGSFFEPNGQGILNRCAISNNGKAGFRVLANGDDGMLHGIPFANPTGVALRISNAIIWNNPEGGISATWNTGTGAEVTDRKGYYLVPVTHSTLVGNGGTGFDWSIEIDDQDGTNAGRCRYERIDPGSLTQYRTNLWNDIFIRDPNVGTAADLGTVLNNSTASWKTVVDTGFNSYNDSQVAVAGSRGIAFWGNGLGFPNAKMTDDANLPMVGSGSYNLSSIQPNQFFLSAAVNGNIKNSTPTYFHVLSPESSVDFNAVSRPGALTGQNDKGADED